MPTPANSHFGAPPEWTVGPKGGLTIVSDDATGADVPLVLEGVAGTGAALMRIYNDIRPIVGGDASGEAFSVTGDGQVYFRSGSGSIGFNVVDAAGTSLFSLKSAAGLVYRRLGVDVFQVLPSGAVITHANAAPADAALVAGECALWFDQTDGVGNTKLMVKGKSADGTVKTATILLA